MKPILCAYIAQVDESPLPVNVQIIGKEHLFAFDLSKRRNKNFYIS